MLGQPKINYHMRSCISILFIFLSTLIHGQVEIQRFDLLHKVSLRGLSPVNAKICWVSGSEGSVFKTMDSGKTWKDVSPKAYEELQFRDIEAFGKDTALILSAGLPAVICKTTDGGKNWKEVYRNESQGVFFDAMDFWDSQRGMAFSDAPAEHLLILVTKDGGETWTELPQKNSPKVFPHQGGFAASGTCIKTFGKSSALIGLGGPEATILLTNDFGQNWGKAMAPLDFGESSKGVFSIDMLNENIGICVGGDYRADSLTTNNMAITQDGGRNWEKISHPNLTSKYLSSVSFYNEDVIFATSRTGIRYSQDAGISWKALEGNYFCVECIEKEGVCWFSGPDGLVGFLKF